MAQMAQTNSAISTDAPSPLEQLRALSWTASQLPEAIELLARKSNYEIQPVDSFRATVDLKQQLNGQTVLSHYIDQIADWLGLETEFVSAAYPQIEDMLHQGGPALLQLPNPDNETVEPRFLLLQKPGWWRVTILAPDASAHRLKATTVRAALAHVLEAPLLAEIEGFLTASGLSERSWPNASRAILRQRLAHAEISNCWLLRLPPNTSLLRQAREANISGYLVAATILQTIDTFLAVGIIGITAKGALAGQVEWVWILAGILLIFTRVPFSVLKVWVINLFGVAFGHLIKRRLFYGVLQLDPSEVQHKGAGQFLAWAMEAENLEETSVRVVASGFRALVSLPIFAGMLAMGAGGILHGLILIGWSVLGVIIGWLGFSSYMSLSQNYSEMTNDILERITGHQTRLVQESPQHWHDEEDLAQTHYLALSKKDDFYKTWLIIFIPYGWTVVGVLGVIYPFLNQADPISLGISFLAVLMTGLYLQVLSFNLIDISSLIVSWRLMKPILHAAKESPSQQGKTPIIPAPEPGQLILSTNNITFSYATRAEPILTRCNLQIYAGDRLLLEGPSGGGKSTLALVLINLYTPQSGIILMRGFDQHTVKPEVWRQRIVAAPQFHENHILDTSFAFNLLMGRGWPASPADLVEAEAVCRELGLGDLLDQMPLGLKQPVGEEGWRLSHGERSRVYIARALLQHADLIILDESFASLDPESMETALRCVLQRANTLLVIAHP